MLGARYSDRYCQKCGNIYKIEEENGLIIMECEECNKIKGEEE